MKKTHADRVAFIDHLEKKYSQKIQRYKWGRQEQSIRRQLRTIRGTHIDEDLDYEVSDIIVPNRHQLAH